MKVFDRKSNMWKGISELDREVDTLSLPIPTTVSVAVAPSITNGIIGASDFSEEIYEKIMQRLSAKPMVEYKCHNCGGQIELDNDKHIFKCPYCDSVYAVGTRMIHDNGG